MSENSAVRKQQIIRVQVPQYNFSISGHHVEPRYWISKRKQHFDGGDNFLLRALRLAADIALLSTSGHFQLLFLSNTLYLHQIGFLDAALLLESRTQIRELMLPFCYHSSFAYVFLYDKCSTTEKLP